MRPAKPIVPAADDGDEGPGRTFVKGRYTATRYQRRSARLPRLSGEERTTPAAPDDPTVDSPWVKYDARPAPTVGVPVGAHDESGEIVVDLRDAGAMTSSSGSPVDRSTWYQRHSAGLPHLSRASEDQGS